MDYHSTRRKCLSQRVTGSRCILTDNRCIDCLTHVCIIANINRYSHKYLQESHDLLCGNNTARPKDVLICKVWIYLAVHIFLVTSECPTTRIVFASTLFRRHRSDSQNKLEGRCVYSVSSYNHQHHVHYHRPPWRVVFSRQQ